MKTVKKIIAIILIIFGALIFLGGIGVIVDEKKNISFNIAMIVIFGITPIVGGIMLFRKKSDNVNVSKDIDSRKKSAIGEAANSSPHSENNLIIEIKKEPAINENESNLEGKKPKVGYKPHINLIQIKDDRIYYSRTLSKEEIEEKNNNPQTDLQSEYKEYNFNDIIREYTNYITETQYENTIEDIHTRYSKMISMDNAALVKTIVLGVVSLIFFFIFPILSIFTLITLLIILILFIRNYRKGTIYLFYEIDNQNKEKIQKFYDRFDKLKKCSRIWNLNEHRIIPNSFISRAIPKYFKTNIKFIKMEINQKKVLYFFPDRLLVIDEKKIKTIHYQNLTITHINHRFKELAGNVPPDADIIDYTWKYTCKDGTPDLRYNNNTKYPICNYSVINFSTVPGLDESFMFSRPNIGNDLGNTFNKSVDDGHEEDDEDNDYEDDDYEEVDYTDMIKGIENGKLPEVSAPFRLMKNEICHMVFDTKRIKDRWNYDSGKLVITNKNIIFDPDDRAGGFIVGVTVKLNGIRDIKFYSDSIEIQKDGMQSVYKFQIPKKEAELIEVLLTKLLDS